MQYFPIFLLILIVLVLIARPLTVLLHELGHAIAAILLTKQKATIYIGTYGEPKKSIKINLGVLTIFFHYNPFAWRLGLCVPSAKSISIYKRIIFTLAGPFASFIIAIIACYYTFTYDLHGALKLFLVVFLASATLDLLINLIPNERPIKLYDGSVTYNDGYTLKLLFYFKQMPKGFSEAVESYNEQDFEKAAAQFEKLIPTTKDENIWRFAINSHLQCRNYVKAKELSEAFALKAKLDSDDLANMALSYSQLGFHEEALVLYDRSLQLNPNNAHSLNNKGYTLNLLNKYEEAIPLFDSSIELDKDFAYPYNNRGLAKIKLGQVEDGLEDINHSLEIDPNNSYGHRNLGIYHADKGEFEEALRLLSKAKELDGTTHMIDELIMETKKRST